jgi:uncharacterized Zn finger protein
MECEVLLVDGDEIFGKVRGEGDEYVVFVNISTKAYGCTCPDCAIRNRPCKHVLTFVMKCINEGLIEDENLMVELVEEAVSRGRRKVER